MLVFKFEAELRTCLLVGYPCNLFCVFCKYFLGMGLRLHLIFPSIQRRPYLA